MAENVDVRVRVQGARKAAAEAQAVSKSVGGMEGAGARSAKGFERAAKAGRKMQKVGVGMSRTVSLPLVAGLGFAVKAALGFEKQISSLGAVSNASGRQLDMFRSQAMKAGADTMFSAKDAAVAQTELAKGGLSVKQIMGGGLRSSLALAAAGELELGDAAAYTANALNLFGMRGSESMKIADAMATAANATTADVSDFGMALTQGGGVAKSAGYSFTETMVALEALAASGVKNSDAGTSLKASLIQLLKPTEKQAKLADKLGLKFKDSHGEMKSMSEMSKMFRARLGGMTKAQRTAALATIAGSDGVRTLTSLYDAGPAKLDRWRKGLMKSGTAAETARKKQDNLAGQWEQLTGSMETLGISLGTILIPRLTKLAATVTKVLNKIGQLSPATQTGILAFGAFLAAVGPVTWALGGVVRGLGRTQKALRWVGRKTGLTIGREAATVASTTSATTMAGTGTATGLGGAMGKQKGKFRGVGRGVGRTIGRGLVGGVIMFVPEIFSAIKDAAMKHAALSQYSGSKGWGNLFDDLTRGNELPGVNIVGEGRPGGPPRTHTPRRNSGPGGGGTHTPRPGNRPGGRAGAAGLNPIPLAAASGGPVIVRPHLRVFLNRREIAAAFAEDDAAARARA